MKKLSIAIVGAGIGGMTAAATLRRIGIDVRVDDQAPRFAGIGGGIQMMPTSMKVLRQVGVEERVIDTSFKPYSHLNREWDSGKVMRELRCRRAFSGRLICVCTGLICTKPLPQWFPKRL